MNMHSAQSFGLSDHLSTPAEKAYKYKHTENRLLDKATEERLHSELMLAVLSGREALQRAVPRIINICEAAGQRFFVTRFRDETPIAASIIHCLRPKSPDPVKFGFHWNEHGLGEEVLPADSTLWRKPLTAVVPVVTFRPKTYVIPLPKALPEDEQARLTRVLRMAVAENAYMPVMRALEQIRAVCEEHGVNRFVTPYEDKTPTAGFLIKCLLKLEIPKGLYLDWTADGLVEEPKRVIAVKVPKRKLSLAEDKIRKEELRAERRRDSPPKGESPEEDRKLLRKARKAS